MANQRKAGKRLVSVWLESDLFNDLDQVVATSKHATRSDYLTDLVTRNVAAKLKTKSKRAQ